MHKRLIFYPDSTYFETLPCIANRLWAQLSCSIHTARRNIPKMFTEILHSWNESALCFCENIRHSGRRMDGWMDRWTVFIEHVDFNEIVVMRMLCISFQRFTQHSNAFSKNHALNTVAGIAAGANHSLYCCAYQRAHEIQLPRHTIKSGANNKHFYSIWPFYIFCAYTYTHHRLRSNVPKHTKTQMQTLIASIRSPI